MLDENGVFKSKRIQLQSAQTYQKHQKQKSNIKK